jgi:hypothetical protein
MCLYTFQRLIYYKYAYTETYAVFLQKSFVINVTVIHNIQNNFSGMQDVEFHIVNWIFIYETIFRHIVYVSMCLHV